MNTTIPLALVVLTSWLAASGASARAGSDFNGDGAEDLAVGTPAAPLLNVPNVGSVTVLYGVPNSGVGTAGTQLLTVANLVPVSDPAIVLSMQGASLGYAVASGDFNGDGFDDLAIGAVGMKVGKVAAAGVVYVVPGSAIGLQPEKRKVLHQDVKGVKGKAQAEDGFGLSLACGNFDGDAFDDLAVGILETVKGSNDAGAVAIFRGSKSGLRAKGNQLWTQGSKGVPGEIGTHLFGFYLGTGDLNGDGRDELVIGSIIELDGNANFGVWTILFGAKKKGLVSKHSMRVDLAQLGGESTAGSLGDCDCGDIDGDGFEDLALSWPAATGGSTAEAGVLIVLPGSTAGPQLAAAQILHQSSPGVDGVATAGDSFASSVVCADFNGDGFEDVACGNSDDDDAGASAGSIEVFFGSAGGLSTIGEQLIHQDTAGIADSGVANDDFGASLGAGDFDGNGVDDLVVGVPDKMVSAQPKAGTLHVIPGQLGSGLVPGLSSVWHQDTPGVLGTATDSAHFGGQIAQTR